MCCSMTPGIAQIVVDRDTDLIDEDVEGIDFTRRPLDLRSAGHVQGYGVTRSSAFGMGLRTPAYTFFAPRRSASLTSA